MTSKRHPPPRVSDPHLHPRLCQTCGQLLLGYTERGLTVWLDAVPLTEQMEAVYRLGGRATYRLQLLAVGGAWVDRRMRGLPWPASGFVLVEHPDTHTPSNQRVKPPEWLSLPGRTPARADEIPF